MDGRTAPGVTDPEVSHITARTVTPHSRPSSCPGTLRTGERHERLGRNPSHRPRREPRDGDARRRRRDRLRPGVPGPVGVAAPGRPAAYLLLPPPPPPALGRTSFSDAPRPLPWAAPGALIRSQRTTEYAVPAAATRMLYHSRTSAG